MKHGSAFRGNSVCVWAEVSRSHSSCPAGVVSEGLNIDDKEETDSLKAVQQSRETLHLATESLTSFEL